MKKRLTVLGLVLFLILPEGIRLVAVVTVAAAFAGLELQLLTFYTYGGAGGDGVGDEDVGADDAFPADDSGAAQNGGAVEQESDEEEELAKAIDELKTEIAENYGITRQAARDNIKKGENKLFEYEEKLKIMKATINTEKKIGKILAQIATIQTGYTDEKIAEILENIKNELDEIV